MYTDGFLAKSPKDAGPSVVTSTVISKKKGSFEKVTCSQSNVRTVPHDFFLFLDAVENVF